MPPRAMLLTLLLSILLGACAPGRNDSSSFTTIPGSGWCYGDTLTFIPRMDDSIASGTLSVAIRHDQTYGYADLYLEVSIPGEGAGLRRDTVVMHLADRYGRWLGRGFGASYQFEVPLARRVILRDSAAVKIRQIMRIDTLKGLEQAGIIFIADEQ